MGIVINSPSLEGNFGIVKVRAAFFSYWRRGNAYIRKDFPIEPEEHALEFAESCFRDETKGRRVEGVEFVPNKKNDFGTVRLPAFFAYWRSGDHYIRGGLYEEQSSALRYAEEQFWEAERHQNPVPDLSKEVTYYMVDTGENGCFCAGIEDKEGFVPNIPDYPSSGGGVSFPVRNSKFCGEGNRRYLLPGHMGLSYHGLREKMIEAGFKIVSVESSHDLPEGLVEKFNEDERDKMLKICQIKFGFEGIQERAYFEGKASPEMARQLSELGFVLSRQWTGMDFGDTHGVWERVKNKNLESRYRICV